MKKPISCTVLSIVLLSSLIPNATFGAEAAKDPLIAAYETEYGGSSLVKSDGTYWVWGGTNLPTVPTQIQGLTDVKEIFANHFVEKTDGSLWYWSRPVGLKGGFDLHKIEGIDDPVAAPLVYGNNTFIIDAQGNVYKGSQTYPDYIPSEYKKLEGIDNVKEMAAYGDYAAQESLFVFLKKDGTVWRSGSTLASFVQAKEIQSAEHVQVDGIYLQDGSVREWASSYGVLGYERNKGDWTRISSVQVKGLPDQLQYAWRDYSARVAVDGQNRLWFWGATITGWSDGTTMNVQPAPVLLSNIKDVTAAYIVDRSLIALTKTGKVYIASIEGISMTSNAPFKLLVSDVRSIKPASKHLILQKSDGTLWGWGLNVYGNLGVGDNVYEYLIPVQVQAPIEVVLNGEPIALSNGVITRNGQAFIPLRSVFEKLGANISWDNSTKTAMLERAATDQASAVVVKLDFPDGTVTLNGSPVSLPNELFSSAGSSYLPLRFISESLGAKVDWQQKEGKILITLN